MRWGVLAGGLVAVAAVAIGVRIASNRGASGGVDIALRNLPPGYQATHGAIEFNPVTGTAHLDDLVVTRDGKPFFTAARADVGGIGSLVGGVPLRVGELTLRDVSAPPVVRHIDRVEANGLELANAKTVFDLASYPGGRPTSSDRKPMASSVDMFGVKLHIDPSKPSDGRPVDLFIGHDRLSDLSIRQFAQAPTQEAIRQIGFVTDAARAVAYHEAQMENFSFTEPGGTSAHIESASAHDYDGGKLASEALSGFSATLVKPKGALTLDKFEITGIDATRMLDLLLPADPKHAVAKLSAALRIAGLKMRDLKIDVAGAPLVTLDSLDSHTEYSPGDFSTGGATLRQLNWITTGRSLPESTTQGLRNFGMEDFSVDMDGEGSFDRGTGHLISKQGDIIVKGLGTLHVTADIDGLKPDAGAADDADSPHQGLQAFQTLRAMRLIHAELKWDDASLVGRLFHLAALRSGQSEEVLRATLALPLASAVAFFPDQPDVADQINAFLDGRHSLTVTLAPASPVPLATVMNAAPTEKAHLLGVTIRGN